MTIPFIRKFGTVERGGVNEFNIVRKRYRHRYI